MKYQRFDASDVAEMLRHEIEARQAKAWAEWDALKKELTGPHKPTWDFWQALFERRDVKALADFEAGAEFQGALEHSIRVLETSAGWASRPERDELLVQYRRRRTERRDEKPAAAVLLVQEVFPDEVSTDGLVAWQAAMIEYWPKIAKACSGKPTARQAMQWLKKHGPRDVFPEQQPDRDALVWLDLAGNQQTVYLKTIQNQFSLWKAEGKIPA